MEQENTRLKENLFVSYLSLFYFPIFLFFSFFYIYIILISSHFTNLGTNGSFLKVKINSAETLAFRDDGTDVKLSPKELGSEKLLTLLQ